MNRKQLIAKTQIYSFRPVNQSKCLDQFLWACQLAQMCQLPSGEFDPVARRLTGWGSQLGAT